MCHHRLPHCSNDRHSGIGWPKAGAKNNPSYVGHGRIVEKKDLHTTIDLHVHRTTVK